MIQMNENPYAPYPKWFEKYGNPTSLEGFPDEYLRQCIIDNIKLHRKLIGIKILCQHCQNEYIIKNKKKDNCPLCGAPYGYNPKKIKW